MIRKLSAELETKAIKELNEIPDRNQEALEIIRKWLKTQPHLNVRDDDQSLMSFLRGCKFSIQVTKNKLDFYYTTKTLVPEFYDKRDPFSPEVQNILSAGFFYVLPEPDDAGARIVIWHLGDCNPDTMPYATLIKVSTMFIDILMKEDDNAVICGINIWIELKNCSLKYITQFSPTIVKKHLKVTEKGFPLRIKGFHLTGTNEYMTPFLNLAHNLVKNLSTGKILKLIRIYRDTDQFYSVIPQRLMPKEYGGSNGSLKDLRVVWKKKLESYREWFLEDSIYRSTESLRLGEPKNVSTIFGMEGSFRKLDID